MQMSNKGKRFLCKNCRLVFDVTESDCSPADTKVQCTKCGSFDVIEAPMWAPLNSGSNIFEDNEWEYECQQCKHTFKLPIPTSPSEDKSRRCPACNGEHLHRLMNAMALPIYCG